MSAINPDWYNDFGKTSYINQSYIPETFCVGSVGQSVYNYIVSTHTASGLEDLLTLYFSHPAVEGVLLWGFWDGILWLDDSKLAEGPNVTVVI